MQLEDAVSGKLSSSMITDVAFPREITGEVRRELLTWGDRRWGVGTERETERLRKGGEGEG